MTFVARGEGVLVESGEEGGAVGEVFGPYGVSGVGDLRTRLSTAGDGAVGGARDVKGRGSGGGQAEQPK